MDDRAGPWIERSLPVAEIDLSMTKQCQTSPRWRSLEHGCANSSPQIAFWATSRLGIREMCHVLDNPIVRNNKRMNSTTRDSPSRFAALPEAEERPFWDAYWTLDEEWHPDAHIATTVAALASTRATAAVREVAKPAL